MIFRYLATLLGCLLLVNNASAFELAHKQLEQLYQHPVWLKLLHFEDITSTSAISSDDFFVAENGNIDPRAELAAFTDALVRNDEHIQCRFPARTMWLMQQVPELLGTVSKNTCPEYESWSNAGHTHSLSVVYATGFLGNPASFYGHTFLKLNSSNTSDRTPLVDISVNYGALVPENENPVVYILRGIFGGYDGAFSHIQYFYHNHNYGEAELRDLWEYELELTQSQVDFLLAHTWELLGKKYTYYFFKENCAYRMAELLELIDGVEVLPDNPVWTKPQAVMQGMAKATLDGQPLVRKITHAPSRQSRFYIAFNDLSAQQQAWVVAFVDGNEAFDSKSFNGFSTTVKQRVVDTLLHYYQFIRAGLSEPDSVLEKQYQRVLSQRFFLPPSKPEFTNLEPHPPHSGRPPSMTRVGFSHNSQSGQQWSLTLRPAYYDELDAEQVHVSNASLKMAQLSVLYRQSDIVVDKIDLLEIHSINVKATGLPGDDKSSWKLNVGWQRPTIGCVKCTAFGIRAETGYTLPIDDLWYMSGYIGGELYEGNGQFGHARLSASFELQGRFTDKLTLLAKSRHFYYLNSVGFSDEIYQLDMRYQLSLDRDIRLHFSEQDETRIGLSVGFYW